MRRSKVAGLTFIEVLLVIAILAILFLIVFVAVHSFNKRSLDVKVRSDVRQLRLLAEEVFDHSGASYFEWTTDPLVTSQIDTLKVDIAKAHGDQANASIYTTIVDTSETGYCISGKLVVPSGGDYWCVDASGQFKATATHCVAPADDSDPLLCP